MREQSKKDKVLHYLIEHPTGMTSWQAIQMFGATRMSDIIFRLRKEYDIESVRVEHKKHVIYVLKKTQCSEQ